MSTLNTVGTSMKHNGQSILNNAIILTFMMMLALCGEAFAQDVDLENSYATPAFRIDLVGIAGFGASGIGLRSH